MNILCLIWKYYKITIFEKIINIKETITVSLRQEYDKQFLSISSDWREFAGKFIALSIVEITTGYKFKKILEVGAGERIILMHLGN